MKRNELIQLLRVAAEPSKFANINFEDAQKAARNGLIKFFGIEQITARNLQLHKDEMFMIIDEVIDEVVPGKIKDRTSDFAETKNISRNDKAIFHIQTTNSSRRRMMKAIKKGARGGIYRAYRLDGKDIPVTTAVESVGYMITLEEILTGQRTITEIIDVLADAWVEKIYAEVFEAIAAAATSAPAVNKATGSTAINNSELDKLIAIVRQYGRPTILGFSQHLGLITNTTTLGESDINDIKNGGYVRLYKGTPLVELPNYLISQGAKAEWLFTENKLFVLPADEKPVKIVFQGQSYTKETEHSHGGAEYHNHRLLGVQVIFNNYIASYTLNDPWA